MTPVTTAVADMAEGTPWVPSFFWALRLRIPPPASTEFLSQGGSSVDGAATPGPLAEVEALSKEPTRRRAPKRRRPHCNTCERAIYVPPGWSKGAAVRRHYWARHPAVTGAIVVVLLAGTLAGLRDRLAADGFERAAELVADLVDVTDAYLGEV